MSKVYVSGKIGNLPKSVYSQKFIQAKIKLQKKFDKVITPLDAAEEIESLVCEPEYSDYLITDLIRISDCDYIYMLNDWKSSPGAIAERAFAKACKIKVLYQPWWEKFKGKK